MLAGNDKADKWIIDIYVFKFRLHEDTVMVLSDTFDKLALKINLNVYFGIFMMMDIIIRE